MPNMSDHMESGVINHFFRSGSFPKPTILALALCASPPLDAHTGATIPEIGNANGYARYVIGAPGDIHFTAAGVSANGATENASGIAFPACVTANWGWVSGIAIVDSATHGAGSVLMHGQLTVPKFVTVGDTFTLPSGNLDITWQ